MKIILEFCYHTLNRAAPSQPRKGEYEWAFKLQFARYAIAAVMSMLKKQTLFVILSLLYSYTEKLIVRVGCVYEYVRLNLYIDI